MVITTYQFTLTMKRILLAMLTGNTLGWSAWLARRAQLGVGLASGAGSLTLIQATPASLPSLARVWFAPTVLVYLSCAFGGWMMDLRAQARVSLE
jgi:hypothetical protein